jgi:hypothetical protein
MHALACTYISLLEDLVDDMFNLSDALLQNVPVARRGMTLATSIL